MRSRHRPRTTWLGRVIRGLRPDRNPLRRGTDRAETAMGAALLAIFAAAAPLVAHTAANSAADISRQEIQTQQAAFHQVRATLLEAPIAIQSYYTSLGPLADARWTAPDRHMRTALITVPAGASKGSTVPIWTDRSGQPVTPMQPCQIGTREAFAAVAAVALLTTLLLLTAWTVHQALNRRRMAAWDADWLATGPRWTSRR